MKPRIGIIGCGIGNMHAGNFRRVPNGELAALCDMDEKRLAESAAKFAVPGYTSIDAMLAAQKLDGVMLCTPPYARMPLIEDLAKRGLAIFCEKPPARDMETARAAKRALEKHNVINSVGFMYRWMDAAAFVKNLIAARPVLVCQITAIWEILYWARDGKISKDYFYRDRAGGPLVEQGVHLIDIARFVLADEVARVHARGANVIHPLTENFTTEETIQTSLQWRKGTLGSHVHCWAHHGHIFQVLFAGADFALTLDLKANTVTGMDRGEPVQRAFSDEYYVSEITGFCEAIIRKDQALIRGNYSDACRTLAVAVTAMQSLDTGIDLPVPSY